MNISSISSFILLISIGKSRFSFSLFESIDPHFKHPQKKKTFFHLQKENKPKLKKITCKKKSMTRSTTTLYYILIHINQIRNSCSFFISMLLKFLLHSNWKHFPFSFCDTMKRGNNLNTIYCVKIISSSSKIFPFGIMII